MRTTPIAIGIISAVSFFMPVFASAATVSISITDNIFTPPNITVNPGDTVVWVNNGAINHNVVADDNSFKSNVIQPGQSFSFTFNTKGTFRYYCSFHGAPGGVGQSGTITVGQQVTTQTVTTNQTTGGTNSELQAQIQALLNKVAALQQQLGQAGQTTTGTGSGPAVNSSACPNIGRVLRQGASGADVTRLQQFLATDSSVYPEGLITGFFGPATEAAVKRWQAKYNVVSSGTPSSTGYGVVGPRTAVAIALLCSTGGGGGTAGPTVGGFIQVSPIGGNAPLTVNVQATVNTTNSCTGAIYTLDWGDNTAPFQIPVSANNCQQVSLPYTHVYQYAGNYLVTLSAGAHKTTAAVAVYGQTQAATPPPPPPPPSSGQTNYGQLAVTPGVGGNPLQIGVTFQLPTSCTGFDLSWGDGTANQSQADGGSSCGSGGVSKQFNHTYANAGTFSIVLRRGPTLGTTDSASVIISN